MLDASGIHAIVSLVDGKYLMVEPPKAEEPKELSAVKMFLLAAIGRRENDKEWDVELSKWFFEKGGLEIVGGMNVAQRSKAN